MIMGYIVYLLILGLGFIIFYNTFSAYDHLKPEYKKKVFNWYGIRFFYSKNKYADEEGIKTKIISLLYNVFF